MISINAPDGSVVNFPDGTSEGTITQVMTEKFSPVPENSLAGSGKALASGLGEGVAALGGLPADVTDLATRGIDYMTGKNTNEAVKPFTQKFGSESIKKAIEGVTGEFYKPQTTTEKFLSTGASFAPAALGGPGGIGRRLLTQVVAPAIASETAGQLAEGSGYEPVARIAGALGGAAGASKLASGAAAAKSVAPVPTAAENAAFKSSNYQSAAIRDLEISPAYTNRVVDAAQSKIQRFSTKNPEVAEVSDLLEKLRKPQLGATHRLDTDFDGTRQLLQGIAGKGGSGGEAARLAVNTIDAATLRIPTTAAVAGDARAASKAMFEARKAAAVEFRDKKIAEVLERAANTASATHSGGNFENEVYKQIRNMLNNPKKHLRGWTAEEKAVLREVLPGRTASGIRRAGKLLGGGGGLGQLASGAAGTSMFGPAGMIALPALGFGLNKLGSGLASKRLNNVSETLRARSPLYSPANLAQRQAALSGGILSGLPSREILALESLLAARLPEAPRQYIGQAGP